MQSSRAEVLLRREDSASNKIALKEKFVVVYEAFFKGEDPSAGNPNFWSEVLLLKVNIPFLERCVILTAEDQLVTLQDNIRNIFINCSAAITDPSTFRAAHALETLTILMRSIFRKRFNNFGSDVVTILCGIERADDAFKALLMSLKTILGGTEASMKEAALNLLLVIITAVDNINQNTLLEYLMLVDFFDSFIQIILDPATRTSTAFNVLLLLVMLANYQKYESQNPYVKNITALSNEGALKAIAKVLADVCLSVNRDFSVGAQEPVGMLSRFSGFFSGFMRPTTDSSTLTTYSSTSVGIFLLAMYELVHLNSSFEKAILPALIKVTKSPSENDLNTIRTSPAASPRQLASSTSISIDTSSPQSGLIQNFLTFSSFIFAGDLKDLKVASYAKLCLLVLVCLSEDDDVNTIFHSSQCGSPMLYLTKDKKTVVNVLPPGTVAQSGERHALACAVLEVLNTFMKQNLKKNRFNVDMYSKSVGIVHRLLSYEKKTGARLSYKWKEMWNTLFMVVKYLTGDAAMLQSHEVQLLSVQIVTVFNLFITYGDTFLPSPSDYDDLYYELMRVSKLLDLFYSLAEKADAGGTIVVNMQNIKTILGHFSSKIEQWGQVHPETTITPDQVLKVIKENYDSLKLKLQENLDYYELYVENPKEVAFFRQLTRTLISDLKQTLVVSPIQINTV